VIVPQLGSGATTTFTVKVPPAPTNGRPITNPLEKIDRINKSGRT
jgi:hypothetical protein